MQQCSAAPPPLPLPETKCHFDFGQFLEILHFRTLSFSLNSSNVSASLGNKWRHNFAFHLYLELWHVYAAFSLRRKSFEVP